jgi:hypothetical protein
MIQCRLVKQRFDPSTIRQRRTRAKDAQDAQRRPL